MNRFIFTYIIWGLLISIPSFSLANEIEIAELEIQIDKLDSIWNVLQSQIKDLNKQAKTKAQAIADLRREEPLNFIERQHLESLLKESLTLTQKIENLQREMNHIQQELKTKRSELIDIYDRKFESLLKILDSNPSALQRKESLAELQRIKMKKAKIQEPLFHEQLFLPEMKIIFKIEDNDTPHRLKEKADYLKDQEDRHRRHATRLYKKTSELEKELNLREKMSDFINDLALFDQQEEPLQKNKATESISNNTYTDKFSEETAVDNRGFATYREKNFILDNIFLNPEIQTASLQSLTISDLEIILKKLKKEKDRINRIADSLNIQAELFYKAAQARKAKFKEK